MTLNEHEKTRILGGNSILYDSIQATFYRNKISKRFATSQRIEKDGKSSQMTYILLLKRKSRYYDFSAKQLVVVVVNARSI